MKAGFIVFSVRRYSSLVLTVLCRGKIWFYEEHY